MKFTLKDYQEQAVEDVLVNLKRARDSFKSPDKREISSFSLTATTGAGKTVMAAAAIEALFWGSETFDFEPDRGGAMMDGRRSSRALAHSTIDSSEEVEKLTSKIAAHLVQRLTYAAVAEGQIRSVTRGTAEAEPR